MTAKQLREKYLNFFKEKEHAIIPSASLVPEHDPTVLFTTAGMHPLVPYLLGEKHPSGKRLADIQKCIRTGDIEEVGDDVHLTFFEMLGNWSLGDYWKKEAIEWSFEFLMKDLGIPLRKLAVSCFAGDSEVVKDEESAWIWRKLGIPEKRIYFLGRNDNWWGPAGQSGPCGPDTEMFYWSGEGEPPDLITGDNKSGWVEIWNDVFMEYYKTAEGKFEQLKQKNVDTGMGLERTLAVLNGYNNVFETELFAPIIERIKEISGADYNGNNIKSFRIIADHIKAATFIMAEGLESSNVERGYVLRRLIRRAVRYGKQLGINETFTFNIANAVIEIYREVYPELSKNRAFIEEQLVREEEKFSKTLERGIKEFQIQVSRLRQGSGGQAGIIPPDVAFDLYQTYGFPIELTEEFAKEENLLIDKEGFQKEFKKHQELSRAGAEQKFKGGLADHSQQVVKYHTTAHLMLAALRQVLGSHVIQKGSNITAERLRFDFSHSQKLTPEEITKIENLVNQKIQEDLPVRAEEMTLEQAKIKGATGVFEERYGEKVKVYTIGENDKIFSKEICGGPHAEKTGALGNFKIIKEEASSGGVRRIKAILV